MVSLAHTFIELLQSVAVVTQTLLRELEGLELDVAPFSNLGARLPIALAPFDERSLLVGVRGVDEPPREPTSCLCLEPLADRGDL